MLASGSNMLSLFDFLADDTPAQMPLSQPEQMFIMDGSRNCLVSEVQSGVQSGLPPKATKRVLRPVQSGLPPKATTVPARVCQVPAREQSGEQFDMEGSKHCPNHGHSQSSRKPEQKMHAHVFDLERLPHMKQQLCNDVIEMCQYFAVYGAGEGRRAHGITVICGCQDKLLEMCTEEEDGEMFTHGLLGQSTLKEKQNFQHDQPAVADWNLPDNLRHIAGCLSHDGAIVVDSKTQRFVSMNYFVNDITRGDDSGGSRLKSASAIAINRLAGGCFVVMASEEVTVKGMGNLCVFPGQRKPVAIPVLSKVVEPLQRAVDDISKLCDVCDHGLIKPRVEELMHQVHEPHAYDDHVFMALFFSFLSHIHAKHVDSERECCRNADVGALAEKMENSINHGIAMLRSIREVQQDS